MVQLLLLLRSLWIIDPSENLEQIQPAIEQAINARQGVVLALKDLGFLLLMVRSRWRGQGLGALAAIRLVSAGAGHTTKTT